MSGISSEHDDRDVRPTSLVEVLLPLPVTHAWVTHACRAAAIDKPRWHPEARVWRSRLRADDGTIETITIATGKTPRTIRVTSDGSSETARRVVSAFVVGMQAELARRRRS